MPRGLGQAARGQLGVSAAVMRRCRRRCCDFQNGHALDLRVERQRIAGDERPRRLTRVDQRGALLGVGLRQQALGRHLHERRVAVVGVAVGVGQLHRLDDRVDVVRRCRAHRPRGRSSRGCSASAGATGPGCRSRACRRCSRGRSWSAGSSMRGEELGEVAERRTAPRASAGTPPSPSAMSPL